MDKKNYSLFLFTAAFPFYPAERPFLLPELEVLRNHFMNILLVPQVANGERLDFPSFCSVDDSLARFLQNSSLGKFLNKIVLACTSKYFFREIYHRPSLIFSIKGLRRLIAFLANAILVSRWLDSFILEKRLSVEHCIFYTYWFDCISLGLGLQKKKCFKLKVVSRGHRYDVYPEMLSPQYIPLRSFTLEMIDKLFLDSENARSYLTERFPHVQNKLITSLLGVKEPGFLCQGSVDGIWRVVTCSYMVAHKRIDLLIHALAKLGREKAAKKINWVHIGDGPLFSSLQSLAHKILPDNVSCKFLGYLANELEMEFYRDNPVDLFINLSSSEGLPVAIMEAQSCGIPVIATTVGGNPEIVNMENGFLISQNPSPQEVAQALATILENNQERAQKAKKSRDNFERKFSAMSNYTQFALALKGLLNTDRKLTSP